MPCHRRPKSFLPRVAMRIFRHSEMNTDTESDNDPAAPGPAAEVQQNVPYYRPPSIRQRQLSWIVRMFSDTFIIKLTALFVFLTATNISCYHYFGGSIAHIAFQAGMTYFFPPPPPPQTFMQKVRRYLFEILILILELVPVVY